MSSTGFSSDGYYPTLDADGNESQICDKCKRSFDTDGWCQCAHEQFERGATQQPQQANTDNEIFVANLAASLVGAMKFFAGGREALHDEVLRVIREALAEYPKQQPQIDEQDGYPPNDSPLRRHTVTQQPASGLYSNVCNGDVEKQLASQAASEPTQRDVIFSELIFELRSGLASVATRAGAERANKAVAAIEAHVAERDAEIAELRELKIRMDRAIEFDSNDLNTMRDGAKLTRDGRVMMVAYGNEEIAALRTEADRIDSEHQRAISSLRQRAEAAEAKVKELEDSLNWIRMKLKLPDDSQMFLGDKTIAGELHVLSANAHGYKAYIESYKCDDKQGEIARLTARLAAAERENALLKNVAKVTQQICDYLDRDDASIGNGCIGHSRLKRALADLKAG